MLAASRFTSHPWAGQGLVEVVDIEHEVTFGGGEDAEVEQVRVAARLDAEPGRRRGGEVIRHHFRRTAQEGEG
jgi:hypothetical protein